MIPLMLRNLSVHCGKTHRIKMAADHLNRQSCSTSFTSQTITPLKQESSSSSDALKKAYQECIEKLNSIQSTAEELEKFRRIENGIASRLVGPHCVNLMPVYLKRCGIDVEDIDQIPLIHVAGTKGKGSVCAFSESILRKYGLKTGLLTSPHLIEVRERIRINGKPLDYGKFTSYFSDVFSRLEETKAPFGGEMPLYNRAVCVLGFYTFLKEKVDVAVIEVGIGGEYDSTNFIKQPIVTGISSLGMDHLTSLGDTIAKIAWHKAGILKPGRPAFTVPQPGDAMEVILQRAKEIGVPPKYFKVPHVALGAAFGHGCMVFDINRSNRQCIVYDLSLSILQAYFSDRTTVQCVSELNKHDFGSHPVQLGIAGKYQTRNAALAIHLCRKFLESTSTSKSVFKEVPPDKDPPSKKSKVTEEENMTDLSNGSNIGMTTSEPIVLPEEFILGLRDCYWPGRSQTVVRDKVTYYVDGAHTRRSIESCVEWFLEASAEEEAASSGVTIKMLVFNLKAQKYKPSLIRPLLTCKFAGAAFCPSYIYEGENPGDQTFTYKARDTELLKSQEIKQHFEDLQATLRESSSEGRITTTSNQPFQTDKEEHIANCDTSKFSFMKSTSPVKCVSLPSISSALRWASAGKDDKMGSLGVDTPSLPGRAVEADRIQVLVTGSLYLVGGALTIIDPELASK